MWDREGKKKKNLYKKNRKTTADFVSKPFKALFMSIRKKGVILKTSYHYLIGHRILQ